MAKEKKSIDLSALNISFVVQKSTFKVLRFHPAKMTVDVMVYENSTKEEIKMFPLCTSAKRDKKNYQTKLAIIELLSLFCYYTLLKIGENNYG